MANNPRNSNRLRASGREKFDANLGPYGKICDGKQAHAGIAEIDAQSIHLDRPGENLHAGVQQLAFPPSPVWFEAALENHPVHRSGQGSAAIPAGKDYERSFHLQCFLWLLGAGYWVLLPSDIPPNLLVEHLQRQRPIPQHDIVKISHVKLRPQLFLRPPTQLHDLQLPHFVS